MIGASFIKSLRNTLITGFLILIPLGITIFVIRWILHTTDSFIAGNWFPGAGLVFVLLLAFLTGLLTKNFIGRGIIQGGNAIIGRIPLLNKIYMGTQQVVDAVLSAGKPVFQRVVLAEFPTPGQYVIGFVTGTATGEISRAMNTEVMCVFVPTTPNPTSGFLLHVPVSKLMEVDIPIEHAIKLVMSAGVVNTEHIKKTAHLYTMPRRNSDWNWLRIFRKNS